MAFTNLAEDGVAAGRDILADRNEFVGRSDIRTVMKPVVGWRAREVYQASSKWGLYGDGRTHI